MVTRLPTIWISHSFVHGFIVIFRIHWDICLAIYVAEDTKLRRTIRKYALGEAKLLDSIGMGFMEDRIRKSVIKIANEQQKNLTELTGIKPSLSEEESTNMSLK